MKTEYQVALVTGASSGIGRATARALADQGLRVIALARRADELRSLCADYSETMTAVVADVRETDAVMDALTDLPAKFQNIDVLVNNAGMALGLAPAQDTLDDDWITMIDVNCTALARLTRRLLPPMLAAQRGHIINMGSIAGQYAYAGSSVYGATKAFVAQFSANLRADLLGSSLRCTLIEPGLTGGSEFSKVRFHGDTAAADNVYSGTEPLLPDDIAAAIVYALSQPSHVNINSIELMPVCQAPAAVGVIRR